MKTLRLAKDLTLPVDIVTQTMAPIPAPEQIAWAAGLFEGEGSVRHDLMTSRHGRSNGVLRRLTLSTTDLDVLQRFREVVGAGSITSVTVKGNRKPCWRWQVNKWVDVERIGRSFLPFLCARRGAAMAALLSNPPLRGGPTCPAGHQLFGVGADVYRRIGTDRPICAVCKRHQLRMLRAARRAS